jgi:hypothetical protein
MSLIHVPRLVFKLATCLSLLLLCASHAAQAQIGSGSLELSIDNYTVMNGYNDGGTAYPTILGTQLTGTAEVNGVTGNGGTTTVYCYANNVQVLSWSTTTNGQKSFTWKPTTVGTYAFYCSGSWFGQHANGTVDTATVNVPVGYTPVSGYINPKYVVIGVTYVTPGAASFTQYCNNTSVSNTDTITNTFTSSYQKSLSVSVTPSILGVLSGTITANHSNTYTQSTKTTNAVTVSQATSLCNKLTGASNNYEPNNHDYDIIWVWLNPVSLLTYMENNGTVVSTQWNGWGYNEKDQNAMEVYPAYVGCLNGDLAGCNLTPLSRTWDNDETWPSGQGPALTSADYTAILAADPFAHCEPSTPLTKQCAVTPNVDRFTITDNEDVSYFQPPVGAQPNTTTYMLQYSVSNTQGRDITLTNTSSFGLETSFKNSLFGNAVSSTTNTTHTFTTVTETNQSLVTTNGTTTTASITEPPCSVAGGVCSPTYPSVADPGPTEFDIYEDTLYGTFLYYPANWEN